MNHITYTCDECNGTGEVFHTSYYDDSEAIQGEGYVTCWHCEGAGKVEQEVSECGNCGEIHQEGIYCDTKSIAA